MPNKTYVILSGFTVPDLADPGPPYTDLGNPTISYFSYTIKPNGQPASDILGYATISDVIEIEFGDTHNSIRQKVINNMNFQIDELDRGFTLGNIMWMDDRGIL